jgi:hypothetical protein
MPPPNFRHEQALRRRDKSGRRQGKAALPAAHVGLLRSPAALSQTPDLPDKAGRVALALPSRTGSESGLARQVILGENGRFFVARPVNSVSSQTA